MNNDMKIHKRKEVQKENGKNLRHLSLMIKLCFIWLNQRSNNFRKIENLSSNMMVRN